MVGFYCETPYPRQGRPSLACIRRLHVRDRAARPPATLKSTLLIPRARECSRGTRRALTIPTTHPAPLCPPRAPAHAPCGSRALAPLARILWVRCAHPSEGAARDVLGLREPKRVRSASPVPGAHEGVRQVRVRGRSPERSRCMRVACAFGRRGSDALYAV